MLKQIVQSSLLPTDEISLFVNCFYLDQNFSFLLDHLSAVENLRNINSNISELEWRNLLGQLRLRGDKGTHPLTQLSGGEKLKVALLGLSHSETMPELLLLDEPENHLDIESRELFAKAISSYEGAVLLVSHDSNFVDKCGIVEKLYLS